MMNVLCFPVLLSTSDMAFPRLNHVAFGCCLHLCSSCALLHHARSTRLETAHCLALQVLALAARLKQAEKDAALYNSREALFGKPATDYSEVKKLWESFEPYQQFWSIAAAWKVCHNAIILAWQPTNLLHT